MNWKKQETNRLIEAFLSLKSADDARRFLRDLMTEGEIVEFASRLKTAELLSNKVSYSVIEKKTGLSSTTIARIAKWFNGGMGGYQIVINRLHHSTSLGEKGLS